MFKVRLNVGMRGLKRGTVIELSAADYDRVKGFVTVLSAPEVVKPEPKKAKRQPKSKESENGVLRSERGEDVKPTETDPVGKPDDGDKIKKDQS